MSDYQLIARVLRGQMAEEIGNNEAQLVWVISSALDGCCFDDALEAATLEDGIDEVKVVSHLRRLADAIEAGEVS